MGEGTGAASTLGAHRPPSEGSSSQQPDRASTASAQRLGGGGAIDRPRFARALEAVGLVAIVVSLGRFLVTRYVLHPDSDPMRWFSYAREFGERFGEVKLAYAFPLVASIAIEWVGPLFGFLVNIPILLVLSLTLYFFARRHVAAEWSGEAYAAPLAASVALAAFVAWNSDTSSMLLRLSNPYRDPQSFVLVLGACLLLLRTVRGAGATWSAAGCGVLLALAVSTRETSALLALPFLLFAVVSSRREPRIGALRPASICAVGFGLAIVPVLVQNQLVSGSAIVPAQAVGTIGVTQTYVSGLGWLYFPESFPRVLSETARHFGFVGCGLLAVGFVSAVRHRIDPAVYLSVPALVVFALFYGAYYAFVPRYLVVLDLFAAPLVGCGAAALAVTGVRRVRQRGAHHVANALARALVPLGIALALLAVGRAPRTEWVRVDAEGPAEERLRLSDLGQLRRELEALAPLPATIAAERPLFALLRCFTDYDVTTLMFDNGNRNLKRRAASARLGKRLASIETPRYFLRGSGGSPASTYFLRSRFDLTPRAEIDVRGLHLAAIYPGVSTLSVERLDDWSARASEATVSALDTGPHVLTVDVGRLSDNADSASTLTFGDVDLPFSLRDQRNYFYVSVSEKGAIPVRLRSDGRVARELVAALQPAREPITLDLREERRLVHAPRFSGEFFVDVIPSAPVIDEGTGTIDLPLVAPENAMFFVLLVYSLMGEADVATTHEFSADLAGEPIGSGPVGTPLKVDEGWSFYERALAIDGRSVKTRDPSLRLSFRAPESLGRPPRPIVLAIEVHRVATDEPFSVAFGLPGDDPFAADGFPLPPDDAVERNWPARFTGAVARIPVVTGVTPRSGRLTVEYLVGLRPPSVPMRAPTFRLNGEPIEGTTRASRATISAPVAAGDGPETGDARQESDVEGKSESVVVITTAFDVDASRMREAVQELEITSPTFVPADHGLEAERREVGILLHRVAFTPDE